MEKAKKVIKNILIVLIILLLCIIFATVDYTRVISNQTPLFSIKNPFNKNEEESVKEYIGFGYKIISYNKYDYNRTKMGTWIMKEDNIIEEAEEAYMMQGSIQGVVVKVNTTNIAVMEEDDTNSIYYVSFPEGDTNEYSQGQEIKIYFDGIVSATFPERISNVGKIEVLDRNSDIEIPNKVLSYFYSSKQNVTVAISEITNTSLSFSVTDKNEIPYADSNITYVINKNTPNEDYTGTGNTIGENTENSTAGYTGTGTSTIMKELDKISDVLPEKTIQDLTYDLPNTSEGKNYLLWSKKLDWSSIYGTLGARRI